MLALSHAAHYYIFLKWFKTTHPRLYNQYNLHIIVPTESLKIKAAMNYVEPDDREALQAVIDEYNQNAH